MSLPPHGALARQLLRLGLVPPDTPTGATADGLSRWLAWSDAIALAGALAPADAPTGRVQEGVDPQRAWHALQAEVRNLQHTLQQAIDTTATPMGDDTGFEAWRRRHASLQQRMANAIGTVREQLRRALPRLATALAPVRAPALARLAALDAVLHQALDDRAQALLGLLPARLEPHHRALHAAHPAAVAEALFAADLRRLLQAELAHRLQPIDGMLHALNAAAPASAR